MEKANKNSIEEEESIVYIKSNINEVFATSEVTQYFTNPLGEAIELSISFPLKNEIQLCKFIINIGNRTVISKVLPKNKAEEKYSDAIASGNVGFLSSFDENCRSYNINLGNLLPKEKVKLISIFNQKISTQDMSYEFSFMENYPNFKYKDQRTNFKAIKGTFILTTKSKITRLIAPFMDDKAKETITYKITYNENYTKATINFNKKSEVEKLPKREENTINKKDKLIFHGPRGNQIRRTNPLPFNGPKIIGFGGKKNRLTLLNNFCFLFRTEKMNIPTLYSQYDPETKETSYCLNYVYSSPNVKSIPLPEKPDEDNTQSYYSKYQESLINETPALFIFLVDQSGSMRGESISLVRKALVLFIQSLPPKSYFQIIGFGTNFIKYNKTPEEYNKENVKNILEIIKNLNSNMGGTNISTPLKDIFINNYKDYSELPLAKQVFLLTDGQVHDRETCINLISTNSNKFRIHAIGIGNNFDKTLIERSGKLGKGSSSFVENVEKINEVVIDTLNKCLRPYLIDLNLTFKNKFNGEKIIINEPEDKFTYQDEVISYSFIVDEKNKEDINENFQVEIEAKTPIIPIKSTFEISPNEIIEMENGDNMSKMIVGQALKNNKEFIDSVDKEILFAKKYQVLSKNTSLFGEILNDEEIKQEKLIEINLNSPNERRIVSASNRPRMAARGMVEMAAPMNFATLGARRGNIRHYKMAKAPFIRGIPKAAPMKKALYIAKMGKPGENKKYLTENNQKKSKNINNDNKINQVKNVVNTKNKRVKEEFKIIEKKEDNFDISNLIISQDIIEGYWDENVETKKLINKIPKEKYNKIKECFKNINKPQDLNKIIYTFLVIYYLNNDKKENLNEYRLVLNKAKKYLLSQGINYDEYIKNI